mgnify:CR=1 FL=1
MILLVGINAKYIHSNLGIYCIQAYARKHGIDDSDFQIKEYTINQEIDFILGDIFLEKPKMIGFSCYIWNIDIVAGISKEIHKIMPDVPIWLGGPEVSYDCDMQLKKYPWIKGIISGEGEVSFYELINHYLAETVGNIKVGLNIPGLSDIKGIVYREDAVASGVDNIVTNPPRENMSMDDIPFPYTKDAGFDIDTLKNRIIYYETSRGCPYGCSYCLSSVDKKVRFRSMALVENELQFFLDQKVPQVKFVDRTFNCNEKHTMEIWQYIKEHDNGITNFHFELSADILTKKEIEYVRTFRDGLVQFEIGVQSTNPDTIQAIHRKMDLDRLKENVAMVHQERNIHQHLDLIAGLPYEDLQSFHRSFNDVYAMQPDQLQLGFLKVLKGSPMHRMAKEYGIQYHSKPPYEVLSTTWLPYEDVRTLKGIEEVVERYYNSLQFESSLRYLVEQEQDAFAFFEKLALFFTQNGYFNVKQSRMQNYEILYAFAKKEQRNVDIVKELLIYDLYARENVKKEPDFLENRMLTEEKKEKIRAFYQSEEQREKYLPDYPDYNWKQVMRMTHMEWFSYDIVQYLQDGILHEKKTLVLFDYQKRNPLSYQAKVQIVREQVTE